MSPEESKERMKNEHYKKLKVTDKDSGQEYVFISYCGNSWEIVLAKIVYKLQERYGLRVYFDKEFANQTDGWVDQFRDNMDSPKCKAFLCFFDEGYVTSYAALMELMHAMNDGKSKLKESIYAINFKIEWDKLSAEGDGLALGKENPEYPGWKEEKDFFEKEFEYLKDDYKGIGQYYDSGKNFRKCDCKDIMAIIQPQNKRNFEDVDEFYEQFIVNPLKKHCPGVFEDVAKEKQNEKVENNTDKPDKPLTTGTTGQINENMTLEQFEKICETTDICRQMKAVRTRKRGSVQPFDYLMASLLRGCDEPNRKKETILRKAADTYCHDAVSEDIKSNQFTWCSNARKYMRREEMPDHFFKEDGTLIGSGHLEAYSELFKNLNSQMPLGELIEKYKKKEKGFDTKNNDEILEAWEEIKKIVFQYNA